MASSSLFLPAIPASLIMCGMRIFFGYLYALRSAAGKQAAPPCLEMVRANGVMVQNTGMPVVLCVILRSAQRSSRKQLAFAARRVRNVMTAAPPRQEIPS